MEKLSRYFEGVEVINGLKVEYVEDISGASLRPPDIYMNYKVENCLDILLKEIRGYDVYKIENPDEGLLSSKLMVIRIRYRRLVRVVLNIERSDGIILHSEIIDGFKGNIITKELSPIDYYVPSKPRLKIRFDKSKILVIRYKNIDEVINDIDDRIKDINSELQKTRDDYKKYSNQKVITISEIKGKDKGKDKGKMSGDKV